MSTHGAVRRTRHVSNERPTVTDQTREALRALQRASRRVRDTESRLNAQRDDLRGAILDARNAGVTISEIARVVGISRQRAQRLVAALDE
jgi:hypothetical protein